jgi:2-dehydropantoate 2-reductase
MFGATYFPYNRLVHNFEGSWLIGRPSGSNDGPVTEVADFLKVAFNVEAVDNINGMKWTKIFVNMSNALPAIVGKSMQETYADLRMCSMALRLLKEGFDAAEKLGITLLSMPDFDVDKLKGLARMPPEQAAPIYSGIMTTLSKEPLYGSILQSLQRGRLTEIDFINGELANQAKLHDVEAKLNTRVTQLVHQVEKTKTFLTFDQVLEEMEKSAHLTHEDLF